MIKITTCSYTPNGRLKDACAKPSKWIIHERKIKTPRSRLRMRRGATGGVFKGHVSAGGRGSTEERTAIGSRPQPEALEKRTYKQNQRKS